MSTENTEILYKIIELQACIIQGRDINTMLHKDKAFYHTHTKADIISIYVNENEKVNVEYIMEDHHEFKDLIEKYLFSETSISWDKFMQNCENHVSLDKHYHHVDSLYEMYKDLIAQKNARALSKELPIEDAIIMPLFSFDHKETIGYVCFMFQQKVEIERPSLEEIRIIFEAILRPLYDDHFSIIYSKCVRVDEHLKLLTEQERRITKKVLEGRSYPEVAELLNLSINTVKSHMKNIFKKYNVKSKIELYNTFTARP